LTCPAGTLLGLPAGARLRLGDAITVEPPQRQPHRALRPV